VDGNRIDIAGQPFRDSQGNVVEPRQPRPGYGGGFDSRPRGAGHGGAPRQQKSSNQRGGRSESGKDRGLWNSLRGFFGNNK
jgi:hypothetical protein